VSGIDSALFGLLVAALLHRSIAERAATTLFVDASTLDATPETLAHAIGFAIGCACRPRHGSAACHGIERLARPDAATTHG
jgi:hypothetical protein